MMRHVLVTGATGGVGSTLCRYLAETYQVLAVGRQPRRLDELHEMLPEISTYCCDLGSSDDVSRLVDMLRSEYDHIPYVVNNAGVNVPRSLDDMSHHELVSSLSVNAIAPFLIMQGVLPAMRRENFGRIINITSGAPMNCFAGFSAYSASKGALNALTVTAAREHEDYDIKINLMSPGPVRSGMAPAASMDPDVCLPTFDYLLNLDETGPSGRFFWLGHELPLFPDLEGVDWLHGTASAEFPRIV
ncbi:SDR family NAD(P)-dependent oxidoreductase [Halomonas organivorans]|uniref:NAD(P)-dependent dehydrogenase (Short-subunit alcohol dehydrogenase family) n=1 Tax=Halomonas organivorans TaxID=257772 RepID=A0A7W5BWD7_9GAMM|nr:SDR family oxidoreductase [Halomonas organivorans]MBB3140064.1 NAD(P)-dependent dehydrogenase (short-subunit alcohol dehydrogenase family) [Halomonas organivorans]